jgi:hypothetical protein
LDFLIYQNYMRQTLVLSLILANYTCFLYLIFIYTTYI